MSDYVPDVRWNDSGTVATIGVRGRTAVNVVGTEAIVATTRAITRGSGDPVRIARGVGILSW